MKIYQALEPIWTCSALYEKFMDLKMHFESRWTQMISLQKLMDHWCILLLISKVEENILSNI